MLEEQTMEQPDLWDALRDQGINADKPEIRAAVRASLEIIEDVRQREGPHTARRCAEAMHQALSYELRHPDTRDMSRFENEFDDGA
jgi:hypothetical protein